MTIGLLAVGAKIQTLVSQTLLWNFLVDSTKETGTNLFFGQAASIKLPKDTIKISSLLSFVLRIDTTLIRPLC